ncbi:hypothetical protein ACFYKX_11355 [Cytobacillus sp. FJAT-54145]|uniref:Uncharacterized protein n=1 Tax=Cytobacillus spartinae TaxID=3299023 RepID=A0ABW6KER2_9BACI
MKRSKRFSFPMQDFRTWRDLGDKANEEEEMKSCERCGTMLPLYQMNSFEVSMFEQKLLCESCASHEDSV